MYCLVYQSVAAREFGLGEIEALLDQSRKFNQEQNITGCLLYMQGAFLQYLEGNQLKVLALYDLIKTDKRHSDVTLLTHGHIDKREFENWDMAFANHFGNNELVNYLKLVVSNFLDSPIKKISPNPTSTLFWDHVSNLMRSL